MNDVLRKLDNKNMKEELAEYMNVIVFRLMFYGTF